MARNKNEFTSAKTLYREAVPRNPRAASMITDFAPNFGRQSKIIPKPFFRASCGSDAVQTMNKGGRPTR